MEFLMKSSRLIITSKTLARRVAVPIPRMGAFKIAPKIDNVDCQDDGLELPKNLSNVQLLRHLQQLHGDHKPQLLKRYFFKMPFIEGRHTEGSSNIKTTLKMSALSQAFSAPVTKTTTTNLIRVLQWNILSQTLSQNNDNFVCCSEEALTWDNRRYLIVQELLQNSPDVICLQEVDHFKFLQKVLGSQNYEGIFFPKPDSPCLYIDQNNGPDGCAIFYKRDKFLLKSYDTRILEVWRVQSNQVAIAAKLEVRATGKQICIGTTHLKARHGPEMARMRNEQGHDLLRFVGNFVGEEQPVLLCGDFNAEPTEPIYRTILNYNQLKVSSAYADINSLKNTNMGIKARQKDEKNLNYDAIKQSIKNEPPYTTWKIREDGEECHTIDYVFYNRDRFRLINCLKFPCGEEIGENRTPNLQYPSDHFSLVCDFELLDGQESH